MRFLGNPRAKIPETESNRYERGRERDTPLKKFQNKYIIILPAPSGIGPNRIKAWQIIISGYDF